MAAETAETGVGLAVCLMCLLCLLCALTAHLASPPEHTLTHKHTRSESAVSTRCLLTLNSRKYDPLCHPHAEVYPLLVTGLGGCGTHYLARSLRALGVDVDHERLGSSGAVSWPYAVDDALVGLTYPHGALLRPSLRFRLVVHAVRCPLQQISSLTSHTDASFRFILAATKHMQNVSVADGIAMV